MIKLENITFAYKGTNLETPAIKNLSMKISEGDFVGIIGQSGAGKTTFSRILNGVIPHRYQGDFYGKALINSIDTCENSLCSLSKIIGSVFQDIDSQMTSAIVEDEILFGLENFGFNKEQITSQIEYALEKTGITNLRNRQISSLSGGQKQKVAIAAIIALQPKILVLDEPTGELDPSSSKHIFSVLKELNTKYGITIVVIEQKIMLLCDYADKLAVLHKGELLCYDTVQNVLQNSEMLENVGVHCPRVVSYYNELKKVNLHLERIPLNVTEAVTFTNNLLNSKFRNTNNICDIKTTHTIQNANSSVMSVPENIDSTSQQINHIECNNLYFSRENTEIIHDISFSVKHREFIAITGENGAGKSTLANIIGGLLQEDSNTNALLLDNQEIKTIKKSSLASKRSYLFQNPDRQICKNTVKEEIEFSLQCLEENKNYKKSKEITEKIQKRVNEILKQFDFKGNEIPFLLSRGQRQRLALAMVLAVNAPLIILDEPTTGLDYKECIEIMNIIKELNKLGTTVIMICHDMEIVLDYAERIIVMANGRIIADGKTREILCNEQILTKASLCMPQITEVASKLGKNFSGMHFSHEIINKITSLLIAKN